MMNDIVGGIRRKLRQVDVSPFRSKTGNEDSPLAPTCYELRSINLWGMKEREQEEVIGRFVQFLNALTEPTTFRIIEDSRDVRAGVSIYENARYKRYFIETRSEMDAAVSMIGARYEKIPSIPELKMVQVYPKYFIDDSSNFVQVSNMTRLGGRLPTGFLSQVYGISSRSQSGDRSGKRDIQGKEDGQRASLFCERIHRVQAIQELAGWS